MAKGLVPATLHIDITKSRWDQKTFSGRLRHFAAITDPRLTLVSTKQLEDAKCIVDNFKKDYDLTLPPARSNLSVLTGMMPRGATVEQIWRAKHLVQSAYRPNSDELMNVFGRMSFQAPGGMAITGLLLQFYKTPIQVALMQWLNQSFNAVVNFTNRGSSSEKSSRQIVFEYVTATTTAVTVAIGLNRSATRLSPIFARCVPFVAVAAANAVNIPLSRQSEIINGIEISDENGKPLEKSRKCATIGISQVVISRVTMAAPGMILLPVIVERIKTTKLWTNYRWARLPFQVFGVGCFLIFMVPVACSLFPQNCEYKFSNLESNVQSSIRQKLDEDPEFVYFNKGL